MGANRFVQAHPRSMGGNTPPRLGMADAENEAKADIAPGRVVIAIIGKGFTKSTCNIIISI